MVAHSLVSAVLTAGLLTRTALDPAAQGTALRSITRAEAVTSLLLARTDDLPFTENDGRFPDIAPGTWYERYMVLGEYYGILTADDAGALRPYGEVTRAELLVMAARTFGLQHGLPFSYVDVEGESWYAPYAGIASRYRLFPVNGLSDTLSPAARVSNGELARVVRILTSSVRPDTTAAIMAAKNDAKQQRDGELRLYTVASTRLQNVLLTQRPPSVSAPIALPPSLPELRTHVLALVNAARLTEGIPPLTYDARLEQSAQAYAEQMARGSFFSHVSPAGETLRDRVRRAGYYDRSFSDDCRCVKGFLLGENLARGARTPTEAVETWLRSSEHRKAIFDPAYTDMGIGVSGGLWVQHFGAVVLP